ncbi:MAG: AAA family ATPase [Gemmatimonadota bacterium]
MLRLITLGGLALNDGGRQLPIRRRKSLALLAYLALQDRPRPRTYLATLFWGDRDDERARQSLRQALTDLRDLIGDGLDAGVESVSVVPGAVGLDALEFRAAARAGRHAEAVALWKGPFLAGIDEAVPEAGLAWLDEERIALRRVLLFSLEHLVVSPARADPAARLHWAEQWCREEPNAEAPERARFGLLCELDRPAEALSHHAELVHRIRVDLGVEPSAEFADLIQGVVQHGDPDMRGFLTPDLIGREDQLAGLNDGWHAAKSGEGRAIVVEGEDGHGKSRLIEEFVRSVRNRGEQVVVLEARGFATERDRAFATARDLLAPLATAPGVAGAAPESLAALAEIVPELRGRFRALPPVSPTARPIDEVTRVVSAVADEVPVLAVVDDAPAADHATQELFKEWIRRPPRRTLLILAGRGADFARSALGGDLTDAGVRVGRIELKPLSPSQLERMIASMGPFESEAIRALGHWLSRQTGGAPGHARQLVAHLADHQMLAPNPRGRWRLTADLDATPPPMGTGEREIMLQRLKRLTPEGRSVAEAAAVLGTSADPLVLEQVSGLAPAAFQSALGELLSRRLLKEVRPGQYAFPSEANQRAVYSLMAPSARAALHAAAAARLEALTPRPVGLDQEIARHWSLAGRRPARRWWPAAAAVVAALALGWFVAARPDRPGRVEPGSRILLADVQDASGDSTLGRALYLAAIVGLQQSKRVTFFPRNRIGETLHRMGRTIGDTVLSEPLAREIAQRENLRAVLSLGIARVSTAYLLTARLIDPISGQDQGSETVEVRDGSELLAGLDRLVAKVRRALGETRADVTARVGLLTATTSSLDALKAYSEGAQAWTRRDYRRAADLWKRALALDSNFAMAHQSLAEFWYTQGNDRPAGDEHLERALALIDRLTEREQLRIRLSAAIRHGTPDNAARIARTMAERYPGRDTWYTLGSMLMRARRCRDAIPALRNALAFDSLFPNIQINLATCHQFLDDIPAALAAYVRAAQIDSTILYSANLNHEWGAALVHAGRIAAAESAYRRMADQGPAEYRARGHRSLAYLDLYRGRLTDAAAELTEAFDLTKSSAGSLPAFRNEVLLAETLIEQGDRRRAVQQLDHAVIRMKTLHVEPTFLLYLGHAWLQADRVDGAREALHAMERLGPSEQAVDRQAHDALAGLLAVAEGRTRAALLTRPTTANGDSIFEVVARAEAFAQTGQLDSAVADAASLARGWYFGNEAQFPWLTAPLALARYAEQRGDSAVARSALSQFIDRWKDGDPHLPQVTAARRALARLQAGVAR